VDGGEGLTMQRIKKMAFMGEGPFQGTGASIPVFNMSRDQIDEDRAAVLRNLMNPPGTAVQYPYIVKIAGEGEYVVKSDGTAQFYSYRYGRWEPPVLIDNQTMWAKATGQDGK